MNVSVRDLKAKLSRYLKDARAGRDVVVTSRGRPVARLLAVPEEAGGEPPGHELLRRLRIVPGVCLATGGKPLGASRPIQIRPGQKMLAEIVV
jgi:prevent-host-death family protein